ncbi:PREDICTED: uncharacterized protein LOC108547476 [Eufriesea mexicana]|uniref:uncharacterized protein LOC108547476 n=1 Tax=Eufriesea mexicana TaxID=516756 RepID=UPI00083C8BD3|nr:PREDICTED: uncharacterized protein LOC108547476 [Eufriesea mexicana]
MLNKDVYTDTDGSTLVVKVMFINFPATQVPERGRFLKDEKIYVYEFKGGQSYHFSMPCEELVKKMKKAWLKVGVFKVDDNFPVCYVHTRLSGCACDMGTTCIETPNPYIFTGPFDLLDVGESFAGQLDLDIRVINLGRSLITSYVLAPNCFVFKNNLEGPEYKCSTKNPGKTGANSGDNFTNLENRVMDNLLDTGPAENLMTEIVGISPGADRLALGSPPPKLPLAPLIDPTVVPKRRKGKKGKKKRR